MKSLILSNHARRKRIPLKDQEKRSMKKRKKEVNVRNS